MENKKVIIVGASHGGHQLAIDLVDNYEDVSVTIYEESDFISFMSCGMQLFLEGKATSQNDVRNFDTKALNSKRITVKNNTKVISINPDNNEIVIKDTQTGKEKSDFYDRLILSSGVSPRRITDKDYNNVLLMRGYDWATKINNAVHDENLNNITIIGSGYIGIEAAEVFSKAGKKVTLIGNTPHPLEQYLNEEQAKLVEDKLKGNMTLLMNHSVENIESSDGVNVDKVVTSNQKVDTDLVLCAMGVQPNTKWLKGIIKLDDKGYIETNEYLQTNCPNIYAIGDATKPYYIPAGRPCPVALATVARCQARYLAHNLFSNIPERTFKGIVGSSALGIYDYNMVTVGMNKNMAGKFNIPVSTSYYTVNKRPRYVKDNNAKIHVSLTFNPYNHRLLGASVISTDDITALGHTLSLAIQRRLSLEDLLDIDFFFQPNYDRQLNALVLAIRNTLGYKPFY